MTTEKGISRTGIMVDLLFSITLLLWSKEMGNPLAAQVAYILSLAVFLTASVGFFLSLFLGHKP